MTMVYPPVASPYAARRAPGYWVQYPDGSRVFVDRERDPRGLPPRPPKAMRRAAPRLALQQLAVPQNPGRRRVTLA